MAYLKFPVRTDLPAYRFSLTLESVLYYFSFEWNERGQFWTMDIQDQDENYLIAGVRIVNGANLLARFQNPLLPPGDLFVFDTSGKNNDPKVDNFGTVVILFYRESTTVDE